MIFSVFAGMIGTAFSVLVRRCAHFVCVTYRLLRPSYTLTTSSLARRESRLVNLACSLEAGKVGNQLDTLPRVVVPMVKVWLPESYPESASRKGRMLSCYRHSTESTCLLGRLVEGSSVTQTTRSRKMEKGTPKGTFNTNWELRDCLRVVAPSKTYGNGGSILKGARMYSCGRVRKGSGVQPLKDSLTKESNNLPNKYTKLIKICSLRNKDFKVNDIFSLMCNVRMFEIAYHKLKSNPGNMTPGLNPSTLDGISLEVFLKTISSLKDGSFQFSPGRRVLIPKVSGGTRPLTVAPPREKVVQEVMRMILEAIFEPSFSTNNHGFRPMRSCHSALRQVKTQFGAASFFIEGDISKCFDSFDHHLLIKFLRERISDEKFIQLIWKALKAGYLEFHDVKHSITGTPQGSIISPILANIYLHSLDTFVNDLKLDFDKGKTVQRNPEYRQLEYLRLKALKLDNMEEAKALLKKIQTMKARLPSDPNFRRLYYVRYADDWLIAIRGPLSETREILEKINNFLKNELKLELSASKTLITKPSEKPALFLGTLISISSHSTFYAGKNGQRLKAVSQIQMLAPLDRIYTKLAAANMMDLETKKGIPRFLWYAENKEAIIKLYNSVFRGYLNYYSFANNRSRVASSLEWILKSSCARLLAAKFKLGNISGVVRKFGKDLKGNEKTAFLKPSYKLDVWDFKVNVRELITTLFASGLSAASLLGFSCSKCGSESQVEMHHVRKLKDLNPKLSEIDRIMAKRQRKQIPLCRKCHLEHHVHSSSWGKKITG